MANVAEDDKVESGDTEDEAEREEEQEPSTPVRTNTDASSTVTISPRSDAVARNQRKRSLSSEYKETIDDLTDALEIAQRIIAEQQRHIEHNIKMKRMRLR